MQAGTTRRHNRPLLVAVMAAAGLFTGLLANGGGFLLVPIYLLVFGLDMREAAGTSLLVIAVLTVPTLATHWARHIDWAVAGPSPSAPYRPARPAAGSPTTSPPPPCVITGPEPRAVQMIGALRASGRVWPWQLVPRTAT